VSDTSAASAEYCHESSCLCISGCLSESEEPHVRISPNFRSVLSVYCSGFPLAVLWMRCRPNALRISGFVDVMFCIMDSIWHNATAAVSLQYVYVYCLTNTSAARYRPIGCFLSNTKTRHTCICSLYVSYAN